MKSRRRFHRVRARRRHLPLKQVLEGNRRYHIERVAAIDRALKVLTKNPDSAKVFRILDDARSY
jgi:hypothetical protein